MWNTPTQKRLMMISQLYATEHTPVQDKLVYLHFFIGGCFGLLFGILLGKLVDWIGHRYLINEGVTGVGDLSVVPWWLALGAVLFAVFIGIVAGLYPARRAANLDPVTALRHE